MEFKDKKTWLEGKEKNAKSEKDPSGYGEAVYRYAENWANLMEKRIAEGKKLEDIAKQSSFDGDDEGVTGFMYGCAVGILAKCWKHGEALRRWHNVDTQIQDEGDKANKSGGVLNPALMTVTT